MHFSNVVFLVFMKLLHPDCCTATVSKRAVAYPAPLTPLRTTTSPSLTEKVIPDITG